METVVLQLVDKENLTSQCRNETFQISTDLTVVSFKQSLPSGILAKQSQCGISHLCYVYTKEEAAAAA